MGEAMEGMQFPRLRDLEGRRVSLVLADGSVVDDALVVSCGRGRTSSVWFELGGMDFFLHRTQVLEAREPRSPRAA